MRKMILCFVALACLCSVPALAQGEHTHGGEPSFWEWWSMHDDHEFRCDNIDVNGIVHERAYCQDASADWNRQATTDCTDENPPACHAVASVLCPGKTGHTGSWVSFGATCAPDSPVEAGDLGVQPDGLVKGISCGSITCGCVVTSSSTSYYFGRMALNSPLIPGVFDCY